MKTFAFDKLHFLPIFQKLALVDKFGFQIRTLGEPINNLRVLHINMVTSIRKDPKLSYPAQRKQ